MSASDLHCCHLARLVLETRTPLSIGTGSGDGVFDTLLVRDANDLPAIPGTSLAGVLRSLMDADSANRLFGYAHNDEGQPSRVHVSWGCIHDSHDRPVEGLALAGDARKRLETDPLLRHAREEQPLVRDHVRLDHRGTAVDKGKFDRTALPAGYRFSVELALWSDRPDDPDWTRLLALFASPALRLGGATRRGYGALQLVRAHATRFDLAQPEDYRRFAALPRALDDITGLEPVPLAEPATPGIEQARVSLTPDDFWRFGQGKEPVTAGKPADLMPVLEPRVVWNGNRGELRLGMVRIPASGIKGALVHRTAYHYRCLTGDFSGKENGQGETDTCPAVKYLFGHIKAGNDNDSPGGQAGAVIIDDEFLPLDQVSLGRMMHNAIDRFTGGVRQGALYSEELLFDTPIDFTLTLLGERLPSNIEVDTDKARQALERALEDLARGRLALGAGANRGHGYFSGTVQWTTDITQEPVA